MVFTKPLTWKCHICGELRPDANISVLTKPLVIGGRPCGQQNIRYCNDNPQCIKAVRDYSFFKEGKRLMTIDKAIEILELYVVSPFVIAKPDTKDAIKLGIEALKIIRRSRQPESPIKLATLPGETRE